MTTILPVDADGVPIPALRLRAGGAHALAVGAASSRNGTAFAPQTRVVSLYATGPVFLRMGDGTVSATVSDHYFPADTYCDFSLGGEKHSRTTHIAAIRAAGDCTLYISEKE